MTIAAGFRLTDGILLCADQQMTYPGMLKDEESKIRPINFAATGGSKVVFAMAGSVSYAKMAIDQCSRAIQGLRPEQMTTGEIRDVIADQLKIIYSEYVLPHPDRGMAGGPDFCLLVAIWSHINQQLELFETSDAAIFLVDSHSSIGNGSYLTRYLVRLLGHSRWSDTKTALLLSIYILQQIKNHVDGCGGASEFVALHADGTFGTIRQFDLSETERTSEAFQNIFRELYSIVFSPELEGSGLQARIKLLESMILVEHQEQRERKEAHKELLQQLESLRKKVKE